MNNQVENLAEYAASLTADELDERLLHQAQRRLLDTLACALGAYTAPPVKIARSITPRLSGEGSARVFGSLTSTSLDIAAFVNCAMVRYLDFNDTYRTLDGAHPSDNFSAVLAAAESVNASGRDFLLALTIAYEVQCRFVDFVPFNAHGWDMPISGAIASALACGRLFNMTREQLAHAVAIAAVSNICTYQSRAGQLSMWKGCAGANGARQGIFAAMLAKHGMTGPSDVFDGEYGLWPQTIGEKCIIRGLARKGGKFGITQSNIKQFPVKDSLQLPAATAIDLHGRIAPDRIKQIRIDTYQSAYKGAAADPEFWEPRTRETADHSMPFCVIAGILDGAITVDTFAKERYLENDVTALMRKCKVEVLDDFTREAPGVRNCRVTITSVDGQSVDAHRKLTLEDIERGLSDEDLIAKYHELTSAMLSAEQQSRLLNAVWNIHTLSNVRELVDLLEI